VPGPHCPTCGREMHYKDDKAKTITSCVGDLSLQRSYYSSGVWQIFDQTSISCLFSRVDACSMALKIALENKPIFEICQSPV
jgi:hypothetical protein